MSDLDATSSHGQSAAPITAAATGKLRAIFASGPAFAQSNGLVDAFAEVFARIASSAHPVQSQDPFADTETSQFDTDQKTQSDQDASSESLSDTSRSESKADVDVEKLILDVDEAAVAEDQVAEVEEQVVEVEDQQVEVEGHVAVVVDADQTLQDDDGTESIVIAAVEGVQADPNEAEIESPDVIVPDVDPENAQHRRRKQKDSTSVEPLENPEGGRRHGQRTTDGEQIQGASQAIGESDEQPLEQSDQNGWEKSRRRLRGRHRGDHDSIDPASRSVSQANASRGQQGITSAASGESVANQTPHTADTPSQTASRNIESAIVNVQSIASRVQQSAPSNGAQAGTRGSTQAVESTTSTRTAPSPKPDSPDNKGNTAETVSRIKLIQRVSKAFQHLGPEGGVVRLRLAPAELGSIRVEMRIHQRKVEARVVAETEAASATLREHLPDLRARLESFGMQVEKLEIETDRQDQHQGSQFDAESRQQQQRQRQDNPWLGRLNPETNELVSRPASQATPGYQVDGVSGGVDVRL